VEHLTDGEASTASFNVVGTFDGKKFSLMFNQTEIDGGTAGLFNYALMTGTQIEFSVTGRGSGGGLVTMVKHWNYDYQ
jgi:hypothetical protein